MLKRLLPVFCAALILSACASAPGKGLPPLNGMIYDADNKPVSEARISLDDVIKGTSDIQGHFTLSSLKIDKKYSLKAERKGYESTSAVFSYTNATQVLYLKMISGEQLVDEAENSISGKDWTNALSLLNRAEAAGCDTIASSYLRSVIFAETGKYADSASLLESLRTSGESEPYIDLYLADLYQYRLNLPDKAIEALRRFLAARSDSDVDKRLKDLEK